MRDPAVAARWAIAGVLLLGFAAVAPGPSRAADPKPAPSATREPPGEAPEPPEPPDAPEAPDLPEGVSVRGYTLGAGETHRGDLFKAGPSINISGSQKGDVWLGGPVVRISGVVDGDAFIGGTEISISGTIKRSARVGCTNLRVDGTIEGNLQCAGATVTIGKNAHIRGNLTVFSSQLVFEGTVDGALKFKGGTVTMAGKVGSRAEITADSIEVDPGARIEGNLDYTTRERMDDELKKVVAGRIAYERARDEVEKASGKATRSAVRSSLGVGTWLAFLIASFLFGCAMIATFRGHEAEVLGTIRRDPLRCLGIGFVSVLVTVAVCLSVILLITIPFILIYAVAYLILWYLARVPVALWLGRMILDRAHRTASPYAALLVGLVPLHLIFLIPYLGFIAHWVLMPLLGLGAMITVTIAHRQARKAAAALAGAAAEAPPAAPIAS